MNGILRCAAVVAILAGLTGCVVAPPPPAYPPYGYAPGYAYAPGPYYYGPPVGVTVGGCWGCGGWGRWR